MNVFTHVTIETLKKNRMRTVVTVIGIVLATAMLTAVTTFISSLRDFMVRSAIAEAGNWYGAVYQIPGEELEALRGDPEVTALAAYEELGYARLEEEGDPEKPYLFVAGVEDSFYEMLPVKLIRGRLPKDGTEIVIPRHAQIQRRLSLDVGDTLTLELGDRFWEEEKLGNGNPMMLSEDGQQEEEELVLKGTRTYTVVGVMERLEIEDYNDAAYYCITGADEGFGEEGMFTCYYRIRRPSDIYEFQSERLGDYGGTHNYNLLRYLGSSENRPMMRMIYGLAVILILLIMTGGVSLVYNSFAISVSDRTRQFGILASTGATPRQIRRMVLTEGLIVSGIGIPLGILSGIGGIGITLHFMEHSFEYLYAGKVPMRLSLSVPAVAAAAATALLTVFLSAWIPSRRAAKVAPMEAIRQSRDIRIPGGIGRKGKLFYRLFGLEGMIAGKHFSRNRKQYRATIFSLFISIVLFISASSFSSYVKSSIGGIGERPDYDVSVYFEGREENEEEEEQFLRAIRQVDGIDRMLAVKASSAEIVVSPEQMTEEYRKGREEEASRYGQVFWREDHTAALSAFLMIMEDADYQAYLEELGLSEQVSLNPDLGQAILINQYRIYDSGTDRYHNRKVLNESEIGREIKVLLTDYSEWSEVTGEAEEQGTKEQWEQADFQTEAAFTIAAVAEKGPMNLFADQGGNFALIVPESVYEARVLEGGRFVNNRNVYLQAKDHAAVTERIEGLSLNATGTTYLFVSDETESRISAQNMLFTVDVFTYGFIILISLIAVANVFNTISTGFLLRRREFAILSSVGMAPGGMNRMLSCECVLYGCKALLYGLPVSVFVTYRIYKVVQNSMDVDFYVPAASIAIAVFSVFAVVFATMVYARNKMRKENVIDNIRQESL